MHEECKLLFRNTREVVAESLNEISVCVTATRVPQRDANELVSCRSGHC